MRNYHDPLARCESGLSLTVAHFHIYLENLVVVYEWINSTIMEMAMQLSETLILLLLFIITTTYPKRQIINIMCSLVKRRRWLFEISQDHQPWIKCVLTFRIYHADKPSRYLLLGLPFALFPPSNLPVITTFSNLFPLMTCAKNLDYACLISLINLSWSSASCRTTSFDFLSNHRTLYIFLNPHIPTAFYVFIGWLFIDHVLHV